MPVPRIPPVSAVNKSAARPAAPGSMAPRFAGGALITQASQPIRTRGASVATRSELALANGPKALLSLSATAALTPIAMAMHGRVRIAISSEPRSARVSRSHWR